MADEVGGERHVLRDLREYQRASVRAIVDGLKVKYWYTPVVPWGWTIAGLIEHLGGAARHWFQQVIADSNVEFPWDEGRPEYDPDAAFLCDRPSADILAYYRDQCRRSDQVLSGVALDAAPEENTAAAISSPAMCARSFSK